MPYWLPSGLFKITEVAPTLPQFTDAGFAIPSMDGAVVVTTGVVVAGVFTGVAVWVQPALRRLPTIKRPIMRRRVFFDVMIYRDSFIGS